MTRGSSRSVSTLWLNESEVKSVPVCASYAQNVGSIFSGAGVIEMRRGSPKATEGARPMPPRRTRLAHTPYGEVISSNESNGFETPAVNRVLISARDTAAARLPMQSYSDRLRKTD